MSFDIVSYSKIQQLMKQTGKIGNKDFDLKNLKNGNVIKYSEELDKFISTELKTKVKLWKPLEYYEKYEIVVFDDVLHWVLESHTSHSIEITFDIDNNKIMPFTTSSNVVENIKDFNYTLNNNNLTLNWQNPIAESFIGTKIFISSIEDLSTLRFEDCSNLSTLGTVTLINHGIGAGINSADSKSIEIESRNNYSIKIFTEHSILNENYFSTGRHIKVENPDITPPEAPKNFNYIYENNSLTFSWDQPIDSDFLYTKIVRSTTGFPTTPTDGLVLGTISGNGTFTDTYFEKGITYYYKLFSFDDAGNGYENGKEGNWNSSGQSEISVKIDYIYGYNISTGERIGDAMGLTPNDFDSIYPWSHISRAVVDKSGIVKYYLNDNNSNFKDDGLSRANLDGSDGNVVTEIPEFYYSFKNGIILISENSFTGANYSPRTIIGSFEASETQTGELQSIIGITPLIGKSISEYRLMSANIGNGWQQKDITFLEILKCLFIVEYAGLNSQNILGAGIVNEISPKITGGTIGLGNKSGVSIDGSISYRGIENPWGNVWEFIEGLIITDEDYFTTQDNFNSFISASQPGSYYPCNQTPITEDGFVSKLNHNGLLLANEVLGDSVNFTGDYQYSHKQGEINIAIHGGNFEDGEKAGLFRIHMGLDLFGKEENMELIASGNDYKIYEKSIVESDLEKVKGIMVTL